MVGGNEVAVVWESSDGEGFLKASETFCNSGNRVRYEIHIIFSIHLHCLAVCDGFHWGGGVERSFFVRSFVHQPFQY